MNRNYHRLLSFRTNIRYNDEEINSKIDEAQNSYRNKHYKHAIECLNQIIQYDPLYEHYFNRFLCFWKLYDIENMYLDLKNSVQLNPHNMDTTKQFIQMAIEHNKIDDAICLLEKLDCIQETSILKRLEELETLIKKDEKEENLDGKLVHLRECLDLSPGCIRYILEKADTLIRNGQTEDVETILNVDLIDESRAQNYVKGLICLRDNDRNKALEFFKLISFENAFIQDYLYNKAKLKYDLIRSALEKEKRRTNEKEKLTEEKQSETDKRMPESEMDLITDNVKESLMKECDKSHKNRENTDIYTKKVCFNLFIIISLIILCMFAMFACFCYHISQKFNLL